MKSLHGWILLTATLLLTACNPNATREINLLTGATPGELARTHLTGAVLTEQGFNVSIEEARLGQIWQRLWAGKADASVVVWLPEASAPFVERFYDRLTDLGAKDAGLAQERPLWPPNDKPHLVVRSALQEEAPDVMATLLDLQWQPDDLQYIIDRHQQGKSWSLAAKDWLANQRASEAPE